MPEGPETRRVALRLSRALVGRPLVEVKLDVPGLEGWAKRLTGAHVTSVTSRGKALLTSFSSGHVLYSHNLLYGRWSIARSVLRATRRRLRVLLRTTELVAALHSATEIALVPASEVDAIPYLARLGPDVLDIARTDLRARLRAPAFARRQLAALLLDQKFLAGIGNYLRAEALFLPRLSPALRPCDLTSAQTRALADAIHELGGMAVETAGVTLPERLVLQARASGEPRKRARHWVYGRAGHHCFRCHAIILRADIGGRHLYACPSCQGWPALISGMIR